MILTLRGIRGKEFKIHGDVPHKAVGSHQQSEISTKSFDDNRSCPGTWACQGVGQGGLLANHCQTCLPSEAGTGRKLLTVTDHAVKKQEPEPKHIQIPRVHISRRITFLGGKKKKKPIKNLKFAMTALLRKNSVCTVACLTFGPSKESDPVHRQEIIVDPTLTV